MLIDSDTPALGLTTSWIRFFHSAPERDELSVGMGAQRPDGAMAHKTRHVVVVMVEQRIMVRDSVLNEQ